MHLAVGLLPERLDARPLEGLVGDGPGDVAQAAGGRSRQALELLRQRVAQLALDVDVRVELVDEVAGNRRADRRVLEERLLEFVKLSVFSAWRWTQMAYTARNATTVPTTMSAMAMPRRRTGSSAPSTVSAAPAASVVSAASSMSGAVGSSVIGSPFVRSSWAEEDRLPGPRHPSAHSRPPSPSPAEVRVSPARRQRAKEGDTRLGACGTLVGSAPPAEACLRGCPPDRAHASIRPWRLPAAAPDRTRTGTRRRPHGRPGPGRRPVAFRYGAVFLIVLALVVFLIVAPDEAWRARSASRSRPGR